MHLGDVTNSISYTYQPTHTGDVSKPETLLDTATNVNKVFTKKIEKDVFGSTDKIRTPKQGRPGADPTSDLKTSFPYHKVSEVSIKISNDTGMPIALKGHLITQDNENLNKSVVSKNAQIKQAAEESDDSSEETAVSDNKTVEPPKSDDSKEQATVSEGKTVESSVKEPPKFIPAINELPAVENRKLILYFGGSHAPANQYLTKQQNINDVLNDQANNYCKTRGEKDYATYDVLVVDRRGFGGSDGTPSRNSMFDDSEAIYQFAKSQGYKEENITLLGYSLGGQEIDDLRHKHPEVGRVIGDRVVNKVSVIAEKDAPMGTKKIAKNLTKSIFKEKELIALRSNLQPHKIELIVGGKDSKGMQDQINYFTESEDVGGKNVLEHTSNSRDILKELLFPTPKAETK